MNYPDYYYLRDCNNFEIGITKHPFKTQPSSANTWDIFYEKVNMFLF